MIYFWTEVEWMLIPFVHSVNFSLLLLCLSNAIFLLQISKVFAHALPSVYLLRFARFFFSIDPFLFKCSLGFTIHWVFLLFSSHNATLKCPTEIHQWGKLSSWLIHEHQESIPVACLGLVKNFCAEKTLGEESHVIPTWALKKRIRATLLTRFQPLQLTPAEMIHWHVWNSESLSLSSKSRTDYMSYFCVNV